MNAVTLYHNPRCSNSRNVLALIQHAGIEPEIVEYLQMPPSRTQLLVWAAASGRGLRGLMREKEARFIELGLAGPDVTEADLLDALAAHPELLNRPIVVTSRGVDLCRPPERVFELLPVPGPLPPFELENGQQVWDSGKRR
ncbi:arsenate reductase (glutaredoxin) [Inhella gelatinilytica]|uniref:Arsenate reductase n=1 Tax=Inhella gelatinilytica TaxID=2795030 RepID=A0A931NFD5_9BURK|nr:arsenate reductase (glutaredoxin) [Inhella gelatinilytica]MBH9554135.1 arsenate reductase (glutaredoxin) [Inhella gelatinilytica]